MKSTSLYRCQACNATSARWSGQCSHCKAWNTLREEAKPTASHPARRTSITGIEQAAPILLANVTTDDGQRRRTHCHEFDRVLGGGIVHGGVVLLGGEPGIGKTTMLLQILPKALRASESLLYVSGEESPSQIKLRADRLGVTRERIHLLSETCLERILDTATQLRPALLVVDSVQTTYTQSLTSSPGTISQVQEVSSQLTLYAKQTGIPTFLVGHVTKEGTIAGPKVLEHIVDTVLFFEGDPSRTYRLLRTIKNRFGRTSEVGIFDMTQEGLHEVINPSALFLAERHEARSGSAITATMEGTRPILLEVQALVCPTSFPAPRRTGTGIDLNRLAMLLAVLEKRLAFHVMAQDVFVNLVGGLTVDEPAMDLPLTLAIVSSLRDRPLPTHTVVIGEVGLNGEVRAVPQMDARLHEARRLGFTQAIVPAHGLQSITLPADAQVHGVRSVEEALDRLNQRPTDP
jgi:DNA repair protein RadA/Sms